MDIDRFHIGLPVEKLGRPLVGSTPKKREEEQGKAEENSKPAWFHRVSPDSDFRVTA